MRIALVNGFYLPTIGGVEKVVEELATRYVKLGHEVDVFCADTDKHQRIKKKFEVIDGVRIHRSRYALRLSLNTYIAPGIIWDLIWNKYDVVHSHVSGHDYVLWAGVVAFLKGRKHIHTTHCPWTDKFRPLSVRIPLFFTDNFLNYISYFFCDKVIAITPWEVPILKRWMAESKIKVLRNGMDPIFFERVGKGNFKKKLGIKKKVILFFGRLHPTKAPDMFVKLAHEILKERNDLEFVIVGPDEGELEKVRALVGNEKRIHIFGAIKGKNNIAEMYQDSEVYVMPSYREGLPLTLFEGMASGLPIVATPCNGIPYELEDGVNGYLVEYGNITKLKEKVLYLVDNASVRKKISETNVLKTKNYTWDQITQETLELYK
jgi:glycosyltransferase involved in cell wall biosynthesis